MTVANVIKGGCCMQAYCNIKICLAILSLLFEGSGANALPDPP